MSLFREGELPFLVSSPAATRGIDLSLVTHVINYEFPQNAVEYLHSVGRTARNGAEGEATTFYLPEEQVPRAEGHGDPVPIDPYSTFPLPLTVSKASP